MKFFSIHILDLSAMIFPNERRRFSSITAMDGWGSKEDSESSNEGIT